ncbi:MAG: DUF4332 domain-containing protein [Bacteroidetes bacterium]|nr:DUF4332 domain-containing protein [Bacteroidota bacterium]
MESYTLDPEVFSLQLFYELSRSKRMIPSRISLKEGIESYFEALEARGIENLRQLISALGNKEKIAAMAREAGIPESYLVLLKREAGSYLSKPFTLSEFPGIPLEYTEVLKSRGIRNTRDFFERVQSPEQRKVVSGQIGIPDSRLRELYCLCDLSRITGVGGFYARIIYHAGIRSVREFAMTDPATHNKLYMEVLDKYNYPVKSLGEEDLQYCINYATLLVELKTDT